MRVVPRDPGLIESSTLLENFVFGLDPAVAWSKDTPFLKQVACCAPHSVQHRPLHPVLSPH